MVSRRTRRKAFWVLAGMLVGLLEPFNALTWAGSDTHYQDELVGERAAGMGGAFTALGDEATGAYYNPAGISGRGSTLIQAQMSAYRWRRKSTVLADLCGRRLARDESALYGFPIALGVVKHLGKTGSVRHVLGLHLALPHVEKEGNAFAVRDATCAGATFDGGGSTFKTDRVLVTGLTYAIAWGRLQLGATLGVGVRDFASAVNVSALLALQPRYPLSEMSYADVTHVSLYGAVGAIVEPWPGWRLGLAVTTPYLRLIGTGRLDLYTATIGGGRGVVSKQLLDDAEFYWKVPLAISLGVAYRHPRFAVAVDGRLHLPVDAYAAVVHPSLPPGSTSVIERDLVVNASAGAEVYLGRRWSLRAGFFTNLSSFPAIRAGGQTGSERLDLFGFTAGATFRTSQNSAISLNVQAGFGSGERLTQEISETTAAGGQPTIQAKSVVTSSNEVSVSAGVGGNFDLL